MKIEVTERKLVKRKIDEHFKLVVNGKEIFVSKYNNFDKFTNEADTEIFKGQELLTEEEQEAVIEYVDNLEVE